MTGRCQVVGGGTVGKAGSVKQGDLDGIMTVFIAPKGTKSRPCRSQSVHSSDEAG